MFNLQSYIMKKNVLFAAIAVFGIFTINAQNGGNDGVDKVIAQAKNGGFYVGANIGLPLSGAGDIASLNAGFDVAYLFEVMDHLEVGGLLGFTNYFSNGDNYVYTDDNNNIIITDYKDASFIPISSTARYYFADDKFFGGIDLGFAINVSGDADSGLYVRPKFGFNLGVVSLIASYQSISGGVDYNGYNNSSITSVSGFNSFNIGAEFGF